VTDETLGLEASRQGGTAFLRATGQLDLGNVDDFCDAARQARDGAEELVVDLRGVDFIDSTGLTALLNLRHGVASEGIRFTVCADDGPVRSALELTGLGALLQA
jgi:two-component system, response regulator / RNA-binding antiterminator